MDKQKWAEQNLKGLTLTQLREKYGKLERPRWFNIIVAWGKVNALQGPRNEDLEIKAYLANEKLKNAQWANSDEIRPIEPEVNALDLIEKDIKGREDSLRVKLNNLIKNAGGKMISIEEINKLCDEWGYKHSNAERRLRASESPQVEAVMGPKKTGGEAIIGYKWICG